MAREGWVFCGLISKKHNQPSPKDAQKRTILSSRIIKLSATRAAKPLCSSDTAARVQLLTTSFRLRLTPDKMKAAFQSGVSICEEECSSAYLIDYAQKEKKKIFRLSSSWILNHLGNRRWNDFRRKLV